MGTSEFHGTVDVRLGLCIHHMKMFIKTFFSSYKNARNENIVHKKLLNPQIENILRYYIEPSTSTSIRNISRVRPIFVYIL